MKLSKVEWEVVTLCIAPVEVRLGAVEMGLIDGRGGGGRCVDGTED